MAGLLLILVILNSFATGWLLAKVRAILRDSARRDAPVVVVNRDSQIED